jgi:hypothetical protein
MFCKKYCIIFTSEQSFCCFYNHKKTIQSKQSLNRRRFVQSGHPAQHLLPKKLLLSSCLVFSLLLISRTCLLLSGLLSCQCVRACLDKSNSSSFFRYLPTYVD